MLLFLSCSSVWIHNLLSGGVFSFKFKADRHKMRMCFVSGSFIFMDFIYRIWIGIDLNVNFFRSFQKKREIPSGMVKLETLLSVLSHFRFFPPGPGTNLFIEVMSLMSRINVNFFFPFKSFKSVEPPRMTKFKLLDRDKLVYLFNLYLHSLFLNLESCKQLEKFVYNHVIS